jgi:hypothetical protein
VRQGRPPDTIVKVDLAHCIVFLIRSRILEIWFVSCGAEISSRYRTTCRFLFPGIILGFAIR